MARQTSQRACCPVPEVAVAVPVLRYTTSRKQRPAGDACPLDATALGSQNTGWQAG